MPNLLNTQVLMGVIATLLVLIVVLLTTDINVRHHTVGDSLHEAVQEMKH
ncbi:MAG: hypothetical protein ACAH83_19215 [Alphaproteobacteria bacterium]